MGYIANDQLRAFAYASDFSGTITQNRRYGSNPGSPPRSNSSAAITRTITGSILKYSASPPHTPAIMRSFFRTIESFCHTVTVALFASFYKLYRPHCKFHVVRRMLKRHNHPLLHHCHKFLADYMPASEYHAYSFCTAHARIHWRFGRWRRGLFTWGSPFWLLVRCFLL